jgi:hypothetical protein
MADKTIRFITAWNGYKPGDTLTDDEAITDELVAGGLATEDLVGPSGSYASRLSSTRQPTAPWRPGAP